MNRSKIVKRCFVSVIFFIAMILFIIFLRKVLKNNIAVFDKAVYTIISKKQTVWLTNVAKIFTYLGGEIGTCIMALVAAIFVYKRYDNKKVAIMIIVNIIIVTLINQVLKNIIKRDRPQGYRLVNAKGYSFPSGHSMVAMSFYGNLIYLVWTIANYHNKKFLKIAMSTILAGTIIAIGLSRVYLGVHYASDVCAGLLLSFAYLIAFIALYEKHLMDVRINKKKRAKRAKA